MNVVTLMGRLGKDPEMRMTQNGTNVCNMSIATNRMDRERTTDWHKIVVWGKAAEVAGKYLSKGSQVCVTGSIQYRSFENRDGKMISVTEIHCNQISLVGSAQDSPAQSEPRNSGQRRPPPKPAEEYSNDNDVPF